MERATNRTQAFPLTNTKTVDTKLRREQQIVDNFCWETYAVYLRRPFCSDAILFLWPADRPLPRSSRWRESRIVYICIYNFAACYIERNFL